MQRNKISDNPIHFLSIDYGASQVGLAVADSESKIAFAYKTLRNTRDLMDQLGEIIQQEHIHTVVIGEAESKEKYNQSFEAKKIGEEIKKRFQVNVEYITEMFTTKMAQDRLKEKGAKNIKQWDNQEAARIILQDWMDAFLSEP